jgi:hypothetical protein
MKTTVNLPDDLMTEVKILAAREQRKLGELMAELVHAGIESRTRAPDQPADAPPDVEAWLAGWFKLADELMQESAQENADGPTARDLLDEDRSRLDPC